MPRASGGPARPVTVWISSELHERLRQESDSTGRSKTQLFLAAFEEAYGRLHRNQRPEKSRSVLPPRGTIRRRGRVASATQLQLYLTPGELEVVDRLAKELEISRSALAEQVFVAKVEVR